MFELGKETKHDCGCRFYWNTKHKKHNMLGPAVNICTGTKRHFINGKQLTEQEWEAEVERIVQKTLEDIKDRLLKLYVWSGVMQDKEFYAKVLKLEAELRANFRHEMQLPREVSSNLNYYLQAKGIERKRNV